MSTKYDHKKIEAKWQKYWLDNKTFKADVDLSKPKYYVLDMFPYPSGSGSMSAIVVGYTATDILPATKGKRALMSSIRWDGTALVFRPNNMPSAPAPILPSRPTKYRQLPPAASSLV